MSDFAKDKNATDKNVGDKISRQAAIDVVNTALFPKINTAKDAEKALKALPSAEPRWIPVTERLPKENGDYLVTGRHGAVNKRKYEDGRWYGNWAVIAWMPLPEPWKGEEDAEVY